MEIRRKKKTVFFFFVFSFFLHLFNPFKRLFAPTSQSPRSKLFRYLESLGKINKKKWSQIWKLLLLKSVKLPLNFFSFFSANFSFLAGFFWYWCYPHRLRDALSPVCRIFKVQSSKFTGYVLYLELCLMRGFKLQINASRRWMPHIRVRITKL